MLIISETFVYYFGILTILVVTYLVDGLTREEVCRSIKYRQINVKDKPELLIVIQMNFFQSQFDLTRTYYICQFGREATKAKLQAGPFKIENLDIDAEDLEFSYDPTKKTLYKLQADRFDIEKISSDGGISYAYKSLTPPQLKKKILSMDLDFATNNVYLLYANTSELKVHNVWDKSKLPKTIFKSDSDEPFVYPSLVKVFPDENYLVFTANNHKLMRLDKNGSNPLVLYDNPEIKIRQMVLDHYEKNVYWIEKNRRNYAENIFYVNVHGGEERKFEINGSPLYKLSIFDTHLEVDEKYLYYTANLFKNGTYKQYLLRASKANGEFDQDFGILLGYTLNGDFHAMYLRLSKFIILKDQPTGKSEDASDESEWKLSDWFG